VLDPDRIERTVGRRGAEARATVPDLDLSVDVDTTTAQALPFARTVVLVRACALALRDEPRANGSYRDGRVELYSRVNVGLSIAGDQPELVPVLADADQKPLARLEDELGRLRDRARSGVLSAAERAGATFTLIELDAVGVVQATPLVTPPQAAALAAGAIREVPVARDGALSTRANATLTLACDQRILTLSRAANFLNRVKEYLESSGPFTLEH
jgi:pyruvate dehydrogenase E2 component (dihydrolipoamide acetyltransferase)